MNMLQRAQKITAEVVRLRRDIHAHPELGFQEFRTAKLVADTLREIGIRDVREQVGRTGVTAHIGNGDGPVIAIRADMDALPIHEANDLPYRSQNDGVMHACGHDSHTAMLLGVAHLLHQLYAEAPWKGGVRLLFQPSEESFDKEGVSGATAMIADEAMAGVDAVIALHVSAEDEAGSCLFHDGHTMAAVDSFEAWIRGDGGHGASPHSGTDPLYMLSPILSALYAIPARRIEPIEPSVISLGQIHAGTASNIIPNEVYIEGTIRSYDEEVREQLHVELHKVFKVAEALGGSSEVKIVRGYPPVYNAPEINSRMKASVEDLLGRDVIKNRGKGMGAEDFAYMAQLVPGAMFFLGAAVDEKGRAHHTDTFNIDESVLPKGMAILAETAHRFVTGR